MVAVGFGTIHAQTNAASTQTPPVDFIDMDFFQRIPGREVETLHRHMCLVVGEKVFLDMGWDEALIQNFLTEKSLEGICAAGSELHI